MIKKLLITFCFVSFFLNTFAQIKFQKCYGGSVLDWANSVQQTTDSGYVLLGSTKNFGSGFQDIYLVKTDMMGDTLWTKTYGGSTDDEEGTIVEQTTDGGYIIAATTLSFGSAGDILLIKTNSVGDIIWSKNYGGNLVEYCTGLYQCFDGGYILCGHASSFGAGNDDIYLVRTDSLGTALWSKTIGTNTRDDGYSVLQTSDSGFVITGGGFSNGNEDIYLIKMDTSGTTTWSKSYGGSANDLAFSVVQTADNGYCIAGTTESFGAGAKDIVVIRTDVNGDTLWTKTYGGAGSEECNSIRKTNTGYVLTGYSNSFSLGDDLFIFQIDTLGDLFCSKILGTVSNAKDEGRAVATTNDGGFAVVGFTQSFGNGTDAFFVKTDSLAVSGCGVSSPGFSTGFPVALNVITTTLLTSSGVTELNPLMLQGNAPGLTRVVCTSVSIDEETTTSGQPFIYPNPFSNRATLRITDVFTNETICFTLFDMQGREVSKSLIENQNSTSSTNDIGNEINFEISRNGLFSGMYFYHLTTTNSKKSMGSGKVIIE